MKRMYITGLHGFGLYAAIALMSENEGGGGAAAAGGDPAAAAAAAAAGAVAPPAGGEVVIPPLGQHSAGSEGPYKPEGIGDQFVGKDDRETIDKLLTANKGYRDRDAARQIPEAPEGYRDFAGTEIPEPLKPHIEMLSKDPVFEAAAKVALEEGVGKATMQKLTLALYGAASEQGILEPPVDVAAEKKALLPAGYENQPQAQQNAAIDARLKANEDFLNLQVTNGKIDRETADYVQGMLMDTAKGNLFLEFFRTIATGSDQAQPGFGSGGANNGQAAALRAELAALETEKGKPGYKEAHAALMKKYESLHGE